MRSRAARWARLGVGFAVGLTLVPGVAARAVSPGGITEFRVAGMPRLTGITGGPDGNVWFVDGAAIGRITPAGTIKTFTPSTPGFAIDAWNGITLGPDGNLWATARVLPSGGVIARIAPSGTFLHLFSTNLQTTADPTAITPGPSGSDTLWFIDNATALGGDDDIGRITTGGTITEFSASAAPGVDGLAAANGQLWLSAAPAGAGLGTIDLVNTSTGTLETEYSPGEMEPDFDPQGLVADAHGNLYYTLDGGAELDTGGQRVGIGEIIDPGPDATVTAYAAGLQGNEESDPTAITKGPDGNVYFVDDGKSNGGRDELGELNTTTHAITEFSSGLAGDSVPLAITGGPDGNVWFTDQATESIGQLNLTGSTPPPEAPTLSRVKQSHSKWVEKKVGRHGPPAGTSFTFTLNEAAAVKLAFTAYLPGRKLHGKCLAKTRKNESAPKCTKRKAAGELTHTGVTGANSVAFDGRTGAPARLAPGDYSVVITATANGLSASSKPLHFTIASLSRKHST